jgi:HEAT repeat protein
MHTETIDPAGLVAEALFARRPWHRAELVEHLAQIADDCGDEVTEAIARGFAGGLRGPLAVRLAAIDALRQLGARAWTALDDLGQAAQADVDLEVRMRAAHACVRILPDRPLDPSPFGLALTLGERDARHLAMELLADLGPLATPARGVLARALSSDDSAIAQRALLVLETFGLEGLAIALASPIPAVRRHAVLRLDRRDGELARAVPMLERALRDPDAAVRRGAARSLARCGSYARCTIPSLLHSLHDHDAEARWWSALAAVSLGLRSFDVLSVIAEACDHAPSDLRRLASGAIA